MDHTIDINTYRDQLLNDIRALDNLKAAVADTSEKVRMKRLSCIFL